jgi:5-methylcytosine-specific restriction endonuclease McrA
MKRSLQELVRQRAGNRCEYCHVPQERDRLPFEIDHIVAQDHSGTTSLINLCLCCFACNRHKGPNIAGVDPESNKIVPLFNPRRHTWARHFRWHGPVLVGRTPRGRATIRVLKINLDHRVGFRRALIEEGAFTPD